MPHLVAAITNCSLSECRARLVHAHDYLAKHGADAIRRAAATAPGLGLGWGSSIKRERVVLRQTTDQPDVTPRGEAHNLVEVINQCATMERLIDALDWLQGDVSGMRHYTVERCHPTTTSAQSNGQKLIGDNDLVLIGPGDERAYFEVSDVVGDRDGNRKEQKDLVSLGIPLTLGATTWPDGRRFLVVSDNFADLLRPRCKPGRRSFYYTESKDVGPTRIFEVLPA